LLAVAALGAVVAAQFASTIDRKLDARPLSPAARRAVAEAKDRTLARLDPRSLPAPDGPIVAQAAEAASVTAFHTGAGIAAALVGLGGVLGLVGIRNPRREVPCAECPGGTFVGAPVEVARVERPAQATA
jgi:hypothetical protein